VTDLSESDLADLRSSLRSVLERRSSEEAVRRTMASPSGADLDLWRTLVSDFALPALTVPEDGGGAGAGWAAGRVVLEELGRSLACVPALSAMGLAVPALVASGDAEAERDILPGILSGDTIATAALLGADPLSACRLRATGQGSGWRLTGRVAHVVDAQVADLALVPAQHSEGTALFAVDLRAAGVDVQARATSDLTRRVCGLSLDAASARMIGGPDQAASVLGSSRPAALLALAAEQTGGAGAALDQGVAYAGQRVQFGRAIGSFQAVKHKLADVLVAVEQCRSATWATARAIDGHTPDADLYAEAAAAICGAAYVKAASDNVQVHGGIGYTYEGSAHLHVKRSRGSAALLGTPAQHRAGVSARLPLLLDTPGTTAAALARTVEGASR